MTEITKERHQKAKQKPTDQLRPNKQPSELKLTSYLGDSPFIERKGYRGDFGVIGDASSMIGCKTDSVALTSGLDW